MRWLASFSFILSTFLSAGVSAQEFDVEFMRNSSPGDQQFFGVQSTRTTPDETFAFGARFVFVDDPLVVVESGNDDARRGSIVGSRLSAELAAAFGLGAAEFTLAVPVILFQDSDEIEGLSTRGESSGLGDLRVGARIRFYGRHDRGLSFSGGLELSLPTSLGAEYAGDDLPSVVPTLTAQWAHPRLVIAANAGARVRASETLGSLEVNTGFAYGVAVAAPLPLDFPISLVAEVSGEIAGGESDQMPLEVRGGVRASVTEQIHLGAGYGRGLVDGFGAPDHRAFLVASYREPDKEVAMLRQPTDGDRDGDGLPDSVDQCPDQAEDFDGFEDGDGCPEADNDGDGILDVDDKCPTRPEDMDGFEDEDGCPEPDNDFDRILDADDKCPNDPEVYNGVEDTDGCPDEGLVEVGDKTITIKEKIHFAHDSHEILPTSDPLLEQLAGTLKSLPEIREVNIVGHTDNTGKPDYNLDLSKRRAASVRQALIKRGIAEARLTSEGLGEKFPLDSNNTPEGRAANRRVEFHITKQDAKSEQKQRQKKASGGEGTSKAAPETDSGADEGAAAKKEEK